MVLTRNKAIKLLNALEAYCKSKKIFLSKNKSIRYIHLAKIIFVRYKSVILISGNTKFICNNPKYLKKWAMHESLKGISPLFYHTGYLKDL